MENTKTKTCRYCQTKIPKKSKICPNCKKKQDSIVKWIVIAVFVLAIIGAVTGGNESDNSQKTNEKTNIMQSTPAKTEEVKQEVETQSVAEVEEITYTQYSVTQLMEDLNANALKAESTYGEQYVEITGRVGVIDSSGKYISLYPEDEEYALVGVNCNIKNDEQKNKVMEMSKGDIVTIKGRIKDVGEIIGYSLDIDEIK